MKRGASELSCVVGVNKPANLTSHDVVNRCRVIFGEGRVGHTGTLDPFATGVLPICVGSATRLGAYLTNHHKRYRATISFGAGTTTDDVQGEVVCTAEVPSRILERTFAEQYVAGLIGLHRQTPPAYSAIKIGGKKSYEEARAGRSLVLTPRVIEVFQATLLGVHPCTEEGYPAWIVDLHVSKGTYIRSLARDIGIALGCPAHVSELVRTHVGQLSISNCMSLDELAKAKSGACLDPVYLLGKRCLFLPENQSTPVEHGAVLSQENHHLYAWDYTTPQGRPVGSSEQPFEGEVVSVVVANRLKALYTYSKAQTAYRARCVFQRGVMRAADI